MPQCLHLLKLFGRTVGVIRMHTHLTDFRFGSCPASNLLLCWYRRYHFVVLLESSGLHLPQMAERVGSHLIPELPEWGRCPGLGPSDASSNLLLDLRARLYDFRFWYFEALVFVPRLHDHLEFIHNWCNFDGEKKSQLHSSLFLQGRWWTSFF